eukprot:66273_1
MALCALTTFIATLFAVSRSYRHRTDYSTEALHDKITTLPGLDPKIFEKYSMFSGYVNVYPAHNRSIFYWFIESLNNATADPVAIWTNGGPGASGLIGMFTELGPFRPLENLTLIVQPYSWVNVASMIFIETPAGVGFSFSNNASDYTTGDNQTAIDNYHFIQGWLQKFPNYQTNGFYITSESYGGHYMPTLAQQIILGNAAGGTPQINLKGVFLGNPYTDPIENDVGEYNTLYGHQLVSFPIWQQWHTTCQNGNVSNVACDSAKIAFQSAIGKGINRYAIDYPKCQTQSKYDELYLFYKQKAETNIIPVFYEKMIAFFDQNPEEVFYETLNQKALDSFPNIDGFPYDPCASKHTRAYLNQAEVQQAIHVVAKQWPGSTLHYSKVSQQNPMEATWDWIIKNADPPLHLTIVSGDDDTNCATLGTQSWMWNMGFEVESNWTGWVDDKGQTGGYIVKWKGAMNLLTVHSSGHMIPQCQPSRSLQSFTRYLKGEF